MKIRAELIGLMRSVLGGVKHLLGRSLSLVALQYDSIGLLSEADTSVYVHVCLLLITYRFQKCFFACSLHAGDLS